MSQTLANMALGETLDFKHIPFNVKVQYPFERERILMIAGGTGITPMIQALHCVLGSASDTTKVDLIYGNKTQNDIPFDLNDWVETSSGRLKVHHVLSHEPAESGWDGERGYITKEILERVMASEDETAVDSVFVCGPTPMYGTMTHRDDSSTSFLLTREH